jgi:hypothetical protein
MPRDKVPENSREELFTTADGTGVENPSNSDTPSSITATAGPNKTNKVRWRFPPGHTKVVFGFMNN